MDQVYKGYGLSIWEILNKEGNTCTYQRDSFSCKRSPQRLFAIQRWGAVLDDIVCDQHKKVLIRVAEKGIGGRIKDEPELNVFFDQPPVSRLRFLSRLDFNGGTSLDELVRGIVNLKPTEYLVVPEDVHLVDNRVSPKQFRSNGFFLTIPMKRGKTLREAARDAIKEMDPTGKYAGLRHIDPVDNIRREYALVTLIEGYMLNNLLGGRGKRKGLQFAQKIECEERYLGAGSFCFYVPSSSNPEDISYRVDLKEIATGKEGTRRYRGRYGFKYDCACEASIKEELALSDMNSFGEPYANSKIRPCKHAYAALAYLEEHRIIPQHEPRTPVKPTDFARRLKMKLSRQVLHGNNHLSRIEQEVILMRAIAPHLLGYERMFEAR